MSESAPDATGDLVAYEDGGATVICDRSNPRAWIRSDCAVSVQEIERESLTPQ